MQIPNPEFVPELAPEFLRKPGSGPAAVPRQAATVILLRGGSDRLEVLLVQRNPAARFMPGMWVFPGGSLNPEDGAGLDGLRTAAARELREETAVALQPDGELVAFARWITPAQAATRFDTWFFLALAAPDVRPVVDGAEIVDFRWYAPAEALAANAAGELGLVFPTIKQLQALAPLGSAEALLTSARGKTVLPVAPRVLMTDGKPRIVLPGDDGYDGCAIT